MNYVSTDHDFKLVIILKNDLQYDLELRCSEMEIDDLTDYIEDSSKHNQIIFIKDKNGNNYGFNTNEIMSIRLGKINHENNRS